MRIGKGCAAPSQSIERGSLRERMSTQRTTPVVLIIDSDEEDVGSFSGRLWIRCTCVWTVPENSIRRAATYNDPKKSERGRSTSSRTIHGRTIVLGESCESSRSSMDQSRRDRDWPCINIRWNRANHLINQVKIAIHGKQRPQSSNGLARLQFLQQLTELAD